MIIIIFSDDRCAHSAVYLAWSSMQWWRQQKPFLTQPKSTLRRHTAGWSGNGHRSASNHGHHASSFFARFRQPQHHCAFRLLILWPLGCPNSSWLSSQQKRLFGRLTWKYGGLKTMARIAWGLRLQWINRTFVGCRSWLEPNLFDSDVERLGTIVNWTNELRPKLVRDQVSMIVSINPKRLISDCYAPTYNAAWSVSWWRTLSGIMAH